MCLGVLRVPFGGPCLDLVDPCGLRRDTAPKARPTAMAEFAVRHVEPTAMFGGLMDVERIGDSLGLRGLTCFRQRSCGMGMQIVHHEADVLDMRIMLLKQFLDNMRPIHFWALLCAFCHALTDDRFNSDTNICCTISLICRVIAERLPRLCRERSTPFTSQLGCHFL
jgi:hypothetical protein